jgi:hypothetical protein
MKINLMLLVFLFLIDFNASTYYFGINKELKNNYNINSDLKWIKSFSIFTEWQDIDSPFEISSFLPIIEEQLINFDQFQSFKQNQFQLEQERNYEELTKKYKNVGDPILHNKTIVKNNVRSINVVAEDWILIGELNNCTNWSPLEYSITYEEEFTQSRQCEQEKTREVNYYINSNLEKKISLNELDFVVQTQQKFGTRNLRWVLEAEKEYYYKERFTYDDEPDEVTYFINFDFVEHNDYANNPVGGSSSTFWYEGEEITVQVSSCNVENEKVVIKTGQSRTDVMYNIIGTGANRYRTYIIFKTYKCEEVSKYGITP